MRGARTSPAVALGGVAVERAGRSPVPLEAASKPTSLLEERSLLYCGNCETEFCLWSLGDLKKSVGMPVVCPLCRSEAVSFDEIPF